MKPILELDIDKLKEIIKEHCHPNKADDILDKLCWTSMSNINCLEDYESQWDNSYYDNVYERTMTHSFLSTILFAHLKEYKPLWLHKTDSNRYPGWDVLQVFDSEEAYMKVRMAALRKYCADQFSDHVNQMDSLYSFKRNVYNKKNLKPYDVQKFSERIESDLKELEYIFRNMADDPKYDSAPYKFLEKIHNIKLKFALNLPGDTDPGRTTIWFYNIPNEVLKEKVSPYEEGEEQYHFLHNMQEVIDRVLDSYEVISEVRYSTEENASSTTYIVDFNAF